MKASNLRIGNFFNNDFEIIEIRRNAKLGSSKKENYYHSVIIENESILKQVKLSYLKPIELTTDLLIKLGFVETHTSLNIEFNLFNKEPSKNISIRTCVKEKGNLASITGFFTVFNHNECEPSERQFIAQVNYMHELQNLYFALTNKELVF